MPVINISVENKIAAADGTLYVCGNSDFVAKFAFDAEWEAYENKTARFCYNNSYVDVVFTGNECPVPIISGTYFFNIGVYAGNLHTTTPARVPCKKSILCDTGFPADPPNDVYNQIMAKLNSLESADPDDIAKAVADYLAAHPIEETDPTVPEWAKADITGATVGQIAKITAVDASGVPTAWEPVDMPSGGGETWELLSDNTIDDDVGYIAMETPPCKRIRAYFEGHQVFSDGSETSTNFATLTAEFAVDGNQGVRPFYVLNAISRFNSDVVSVIYFDVSTPPFASGEMNRIFPNGVNTAPDHYPVSNEIAITDMSAITKITIRPKYKFVQGQGSIGRFVSGGRLRIYGVRK